MSNAATQTSAKVLPIHSPEFTLQPVAYVLDQVFHVIETDTKQLVSYRSPVSTARMKYEITQDVAVVTLHSLAIKFCSVIFVQPYRNVS
jgi:hypothetical protein